MKRKIIYRLTEDADYDDWLKVAASVKYIMRHPLMDTDPEFQEYARRKIEQKDALVAYDVELGEGIGFIGFSKHFNRITWLGVHEDARNQGVGYLLLEQALMHLNKNKNITVNTYRSNYDPGQPARRLYQRFGFIESNNTLVDNFGEICELTIYPK